MNKTNPILIEKALRDQIIKVIENNTNSRDKIIKALTECKNYFIYQAILEKTAKESGFRLSNFQSNQTLELIFDISKG